VLAADRGFLKIFGFCKDGMQAATSQSAGFVSFAEVAS
jgi:hypothetical protein